MKSKRHYNIPIFIPELGCRFQCVFCNQNQIASVDAPPEPTEVTRVINEYLDTISKNPGQTQVAFFGGSFTGLPINKQEEYLKTVQPYIQSGKVQSIRISTRPDFITAEILEMLKFYHVSDIELGAQSLDDEVLKISGRGHNVQDVLYASTMIRAAGFALGLQMMIGLPGDTFEKAITTAKKIIAAGAVHTRIYPALVIKDTRMERWFHQKKYIPLHMDDAVEWAASLLPIFEEANVKLLRVGLHPSEGLLTGTSLVAGPFHVSFREMVYSRIWKKNIAAALNFDTTAINITVGRNQLNYAIGYQSENKNWLKKQFDKVSYAIDPMLEARDFYINEVKYTAC